MFGIFNSMPKNYLSLSPANTQAHNFFDSPRELTGKYNCTYPIKSENVACKCRIKVETLYYMYIPSLIL